MKQPLVAVLVGMQTSFQRGIVEGIAGHPRARGSWRVRFDPYREEANLGGLDRCDAAISGLGPEAAERLLDWGRPVVNCVNESLDRRFAANVSCNDEAVGRLVAEDLVSRGYTRFAAVGMTMAHSSSRLAGYLDALLALGHEAEVLDLRWGGADRSRMLTDADLTRWLLGLPKPVALFATNDVLGNRVIELAGAADVDVPEALVVVGVDNDPALCGLSRPPLSSVELATEHIGHSAAGIIDAILHGGDGSARDITVSVPPRRLVHRQSSNALAIDDADVAAALSFIRQNATRGIGVGDVLDHVPISRRSLELRFTRLLRRTPKQEILRVRIELAKAELATTALQVGEIAHRCGFGDQTRFGIAFKRAVGTTPTAFRRKFLVGRPAGRRG
ncbi:XylR family transcriptional regulator [Phycisphaera mikurensis]|uniref:Putative AraC family transcriptional regulator n=1 Tax=Phycisphaera mikurensis (strain NBRC 102666 / KCTC 22515 / FYK2301M01) TaxID=1142394 RepID=I0IBN1_PHYMF|nr:XylR family transcriptional regulator [Phycisphaera mikurensis]MBB6442802.1 LacI family transcriptional regulator [Phycisphaera mikurensis]BAM02669.1 putative AraC family transcriptional regulator [Phycisphaera mikurensis NBRC 102666]